MKILLRIILLFLLFPQYAEAVNAVWHRHPFAVSGQHTVFRTSFGLDKAPEKMAVRLTACAHHVLYVNGWNVGHGWPAGPEMMVSVEYDLTPYLYIGENTVAVLTDCPMIGVGGLDHEWQTALTGDSNDCYIGTQTPLEWAKNADSSRPVWMATVTPWSHELPLLTMSKGLDLQPMTENLPDRMPQPFPNGRPYEYVNKPLYNAHARENPPFWERYGGLPGGNSLAGTVYRLTLRKAKKGQRITVNGISYIATGATDEQFCPLFTTQGADSLTITTDSTATTDCIVNIERINLYTAF